MGILNIFDKKPKVNGIVKYLQLDDWWLNELDDDERAIIINTYSPLGGSGSIVEGDVRSSSQSQLHFMWGLIGWFNKTELRHIAYKIINKAESLISQDSNPLDVHFLYGQKLETYYKARDARVTGIELAIEACEQQISYSEAAAIEYIKKYGGSLPGHKGYKQLAIILEKQERFTEAIELCQKAKDQGWAGDWEKRIKRCYKRINA